MKRAALILVLLSSLVGCSDVDPPDTSEVGAQSSSTATPSPTPQSPLEKALEQELNFSDTDTAFQRLQIRQAVANYLKAAQPEWKVEAISLTNFTSDSSYYAGVDASSGEKHQVYRLKVWFFVKDNGETYWKVTPLEKEQ